MADQRKGTGSSGTAGGTDVEPLRGGMDEIDRGQAGPRSDAPPSVQREPDATRERERQGGPTRPSYAGQENEPETAAKKDPPSPYHDVHVSEGGLTPQARPGEGRTPARPAGEIEATAGRKIREERGELENEAPNAPRRDPTGRGEEP